MARRFRIVEKHTIQENTEYILEEVVVVTFRMTRKSDKHYVEASTEKDVRNEYAKHFYRGGHSLFDVEVEEGK